MNNLIVEFGLQSWKPVLTALVLPPVPLLVLILVGARLLPARRWIGHLLIWTCVFGLWFGSLVAVAEWLGAQALRIPPALAPAQVAELEARVAAREPVAIVVLGGGQETRAPEYAAPNLGMWSLERLRYGLWLSRKTGAPVGYSGGVGWAGDASEPAEAQVAARLAERDFERRLRWTETASRDTRENARRMLAMLRRDGIREIVLVTHAWHLPRALHAFEQAAGGDMRITPAPMGMAPRIERPVLRWLPSAEGFTLMRQVLREWLGRLAGA